MLLFAFVYEDNSGNIQEKINIDENIFLKLAKDEMSALDELYFITERTIYAYAVSLTKDHQVALDLLQDTYLKILSAAHLYKPMGKPLAWMFTIARNLHYSNIKREKRSIPMNPQDLARNNSFSYITNIDDRLVLEGVLNKLSEEERQIVMLHAVSGMKHREIAEVLDLKLSTTLSKYKRALKKLRSYLEEEGAGHE